MKPSTRPRRGRKLSRTRRPASASSVMPSYTRTAAYISNSFASLPVNSLAPLPIGPRTQTTTRTAPDCRQARSLVYDGDCARLPSVRERLSLAFPFLLAAIVPLAGLALAGIRVSEKRYHDAWVLAAAAVLGALIWVLALSA